VISSFNKVAQNQRVTFNGNVAIGSQVSLQQLRDAYNVVVLCYGSTEDRLLGIEGEQSPCVLPARRFVGWYNGVPEDKDLEFDLNCERVVIVGQGNVALDCARILLSSVDTHLRVSHALFISNVFQENELCSKILCSSVHRHYRVCARKIKSKSNQTSARDWTSRTASSRIQDERIA
jgi:hypothetical protein